MKSEDTSQRDQHFLSDTSFFLLEKDLCITQNYCILC